MNNQSFYRKSLFRIASVVRGRTFRHVSHDYLMRQSDYRLYSPGEFRVLLQYQALFKKNPWIFDKTIDTAQVALENFLRCEHQCSETNSRLMKPMDYRNRSLLNTARHYVSNILKEFSFLELQPDFGPGSSYNLRGKHANIITKLRTAPEVTSFAYDFVKKLVFVHMPLYAISSGLLIRSKGSIEFSETDMPIVRGNCFTTVPKTVLTDRPICIEPLGNMIAQKAVGTLIRQRLKVAGLDINHAPDKHHKYVHDGSINGINASVDLSSASDTISYELVKYLLPSDWFGVLSRLRCSVTELPDGSSIHNEKFSSMGNGFTFELETLIFYCLVKAYKRHYGNKEDLVSCFGDDIICPSAYGEGLLDFLKFCGFTPNNDKTFMSGSYRESCGKDFYCGQSVRPIYIKELPGNEIEQLYYLANRVSDISLNLYGYYECIQLRDIWKDITKRIPHQSKCYGEQVIDQHLYGFGSRQATYSYKDGVRYKKILVKVSRGLRIPDNPDLCLSAACYGLDSNGVTTRVTKYVSRLRWVAGVA